MKALRRAFFDLLDLAPARRAEALARMALDDDERALIDKMLAADGAAHAWLDADARVVAGALRVIEAPLPAPAIGDEVGPFQIVGVLGAGGSSDVFLGERRAGSGVQRVAIKVLRARCVDEHERALFDREVEILARLRHADIARLIEAGVSRVGAPFIAMEYFDGVPITTAAARARLRLDDRLRLFARLCRAISAAHADLVAHRDIKPGNVLLGAAGDLKVVDFGVAAFLHEAGRAGAPLATRLTPEYAAPEQFLRAGGHGVSVDVFALGVLLGELITGHRVAEGPASRTALTMPRGDDGLPRPTRLARRLRGDLDAIVARATAWRPEDRYASVEALGEDVTRHLQQRPIAIRRGQRGYVLTTHLRRWRAPIAAAAVVLVALIALTVAVVHNARLASREAARADVVRDFVVQTFTAARAALPRDIKPGPRAVAAAARERIARAHLDEATRAEVALALGQMLLSMSEAEEARRAFADAIARLPPGRDDPHRAAALLGLAESLQVAGEQREALDVLAGLEREIGKGTIDNELEVLRIESTARVALGQFDRAIALTERAAERATIAFGADAPRTLHARAERGAALAIAGRHREGLAVLRPLRADWDASGHPRDWQYAAMMQNLAVCEFETGDNQAAVNAFEAVLEAKRGIYDPPHESLAVTHRSLGTVQNMAGHPVEAIAHLESALAMQRELLGDDHLEVLKTRDALASPLQKVGRVAQAEREFTDILATCAQSQLSDDLCARSEQNLGQLLLNQGKLAEAVGHFEAALRQRRQLFGDDHANVASSLVRLANARAWLGQSAIARDQAQRAQVILTRLGRERSREGALANAALARALLGEHEAAAALTEIDTALASWSQDYEDSRRAEFQLLRARALWDLDRRDEARAMAMSARTLADGATGVPPLLLRELQALPGALTAPASPPIAR